MRLDVYTVVWNEEYMLKYFLRYYETIADRIYIIDDNSTDGTKDLVKSCPKAVLIPYPYKTGFNEDDKTQCLATEYRKHSRDADWVICVDYDEFLYHPDMRNFLKERRAKGVRAIRATGYFFASKEIPDTDGQLFDAMPYRFRLKKRLYSYDKEVLFDPKLDVEFQNGCHPPTIFSDGVRAIWYGLSLYHCCYLSKQWIIDHLDKRIGRMNDSAYKQMYINKKGQMLNKAFNFYDRIINEGSGNNS